MSAAAIDAVAYVAAALLILVCAIIVALITYERSRRY